MLRVEVNATIRPTEDAQKVRQAVLNLFPDAQIEETPEGIVAKTDNLARLRELIRSHQIPDSARGAMLADLAEDGRSTHFTLGKQAACAGHPHFGAIRSPLGDFEVLLASDVEGEVERAVYRAAHDTTVEPEWAEIPRSQRPDASAE